MKVKSIMTKLLLLLLMAAFVGLIWKRRFVIGALTYGRQAQQGHLRVGDAAPDVQLTKLDGQTSVSLKSLWEDLPLVMIFGSFT